MRLLFLYSNIGTGNIHHFLIGVASISAVLKARGHQTGLLCIEGKIDRKKLMRKVDQFSPDVIGVSTATNQWPFARIFAGWIKESKGIPIVCGGIHPTLAPREVIECPEVDYVCIGEGEYPMVDLLERLQSGKDAHGIANIWSKSDGQPGPMPPLRPIIADLDSLPFLDRDIFNYSALLKNKAGEAELMAGRGCPYNCSYCCNNALSKVYSDQKKSLIRWRSQENVMEELSLLAARYDVKRFYFQDDTFTLSHKWVKEFCRLYSRKFKLPFKVWIRVESINEEVLSTLRQAGCDTLLVGVESGSEKLRREVLNRRMTNDQIIKTFKLAHKLGFVTWSFNIIGFPGETKEMLKETIKINRIIEPNHVQTSIFYPFPGTDLYEFCKNNGLLTPKQKKSFFETKSTITLTAMSKWELAFYSKLFLFNVLIIKLKKDGFFKLLREILGSPQKSYIIMHLLRKLGLLSLRNPLATLTR